jgi:protease-4
MFSIKLQRMLKRLNPIRGIRWAAFWLSNWRRQRAKIDYITILLPAQMPLLPERRSWLRKRVLGAPPVSLVELDRLLERIGNDPRPKGVILHLRGLTLSLADLQTLRGSLLRLRAKGKRVICFALGYDNATYYLASATDEIVLQPGGELNTIGMRREATFLKDALARVGVELESVAISPYKGAFDQFTRNDISPEGREQLEWLLDSQFNQWVQGIAEGRKLSADAVRAMIDAAPYLDEEAAQKGYVDAVETEESLFRRLKAEHWLSWEAADKKLLKKWRKSADKVVGLLRIEGLMVAGTSGKPPIELPIPFIGGERAGDLTVVAQVRELMNDDRVGSVIVYVDSGGGAADAAEAMTSALLELAASRPVVVYMNAVAASGGYYVATPAQWIVAQPGTITGSIGVINAKAVTSGLYERLSIHRLEFTRGANAAYQSDFAPFTPAQRERSRQSIERIYRQFVGHVARARRMDAAAVDAVGGGRVWTGVQAKEHGLVDELGDLWTALRKARSLANLPDDAPLVIMGDADKPLPPQLADKANPAATLAYLNENLNTVAGGKSCVLLPLEWKG